MSSRSKKEEHKREEQKKDDMSTSSIMAMLTSTLTEHKTSLSAEFNAAFSKLEKKLDDIQSKLLDHQQRIISIEMALESTDEDLRATVAENARLKAKLVNLESRSRRNNIRVIGLPENIEGPHPTTFFSNLLMDVLGEHILTSPPELDRAH